MRILLVEDDTMLGSTLQLALERHAYGVDWAKDGEEVLAMAHDLPYALIVLDINLPKLSGLEVLKKLRSEKNRIPILLLTARDTPQQKVEGLDAGADDYLIKPFDLDELLARVRALIRRSDGRTETVLQVGEVTLDPTAGNAQLAGKAVILTAKEFRTLKLLMERAGKFVSKGDIEYVLYSADDAVESNTVEVSIYNLRKKLGAHFITTSRGMGYKVGV